MYNEVSLKHSPGAIAMARSVQATKERLISTAEALFAARGLDGVSLNEITKAAGQRNASALNYHFGGKDGLLDAILDKHQPALDAERRRMLEKLESTEDVTLRSLVEVLVLPLVAKLDDPDGGPEYIRVMAQLIGSPTHSFLDQGTQGMHSGGSRLMRAITKRLAGLSRPARRTRTLLVVSLLFHGLSDFARLQEAGVVSGMHRNLLVASLLDGLVGILDVEAIK
jgi:AcrR family transcriptional regulator